jgi:hypothetical protein
MPELASMLHSVSNKQQIVVLVPMPVTQAVSFAGNVHLAMPFGEPLF